MIRINWQKKLREYSDEILDLKTHLGEIEAKFEALKTGQAKDDSLHEFLQDNKVGLARIRGAIMDLPPEDKKLLIESQLKNRIEVSVHPEADSGWGTNAYRFTFNQEIFQRLILGAGEKARLDINGGEIT
ncbi:MAG: hypothetical protein V3S64_13635, partial [bacterium]